MKCLCCGKTIRENASNAEKEWSWHKKCVKSFFMTEEMPFLDITKEQLERLANETVNEGSSWEEFFIGALTGALGMPRFRSMRNKQGGI